MRSFHFSVDDVLPPSLNLELIIRSEDIKGLFINFENNKL